MKLLLEVCLCVLGCVFVFLVSHSFSACPSHWLSHSLNVQEGMFRFPWGGPDLTTARSTPHAGNPSHWGNYSTHLLCVLWARMSAFYANRQFIRTGHFWKSVHLIWEFAPQCWDVLAFTYLHPSTIMKQCRLTLLLITPVLYFLIKLTLHLSHSVTCIDFVQLWECCWSAHLQCHKMLP